MSKRPGKSQASSARAAASTFGAAFSSSSTPTFGASASQLSYITGPPDLSAISDPSVIVYFKNLSKKDSITKARALEDLQAYVAKLQDPVEEGVLEAWINMFPRVSIDNDRLVRTNAHQLQGQLAASAGKRFARHMPKSVGAWLCGLYDTDRAAVDATQNSLRQVFNTPEKMQSIRRAYQQPILEYCRDAIEKETSQTLSDERTVSADSAEAKYSRVISACISLLGSLLANLNPDGLSKYRADYDGLLGNNKLWSFVSQSDASVRRALHRFLRTCLDKQSEIVERHLQTIGKAYISSGLDSDQAASSLDYIDTLVLLTKAYPTVWTRNYTSKTPADRKFRQFMKKGSQSGPRQFWDRMTSLLDALPNDILPQNPADAIKFLGAMHDGISRRDEPRINLESAYSAYLGIAASLCARLPDEDQLQLLEERLLPIISQHLRPISNSHWTVPPSGTHLVAKAMSVGVMPAIIEANWPEFTKQLVNDIKTSAPEQSKDYEKSQNALIGNASRFAKLQKQALETQKSAHLRVLFENSSASVIQEAFSIVSNREGKPYGAAGAVAELLHHNRELVLATSETVDQLEEFLRSGLPRLILSPSMSYLVDVLYSLFDVPSFGQAWAATLQSILEGSDSPTRSKALDTLLTSPRVPKSFDLALDHPALQSYVKSIVRSALSGSTEWDAFHHLLQSPAKILATDTTDEILSYMTQSLSLSQETPYALQGLRQIIRQNPSMLKDFLSTPQGSSLLQGLLLASESDDEVTSREAATMNASIQTLLSAGSDTKLSIYNLLQQGLKEATQTSVSVETLIELAKQLVKPGSSWEDMAGIFPSTDDWNSALAPFLDIAPKTSLAIANPLSGAIYLVQPDLHKTLDRKIARDTDGYSAAYRITRYVTRLFKESDNFPIEKIPSDVYDVFFRNVAFTIQLADDNLGLAGANGLWAEYNPDVEADAMSFMADAQPFVTQELKRMHEVWLSNSETSLLSWATKLLSKIEPEASPRSYYSARTYSVLIADAIEICGWKQSQNAQIQEILKTVRKSKGIFPLVGLLEAFKEPFAASKSCERMCNELVADLTGLNIEQRPDECLQQLVLLNTLLYGQHGISQSIARQRLVFFVKHIIPWLHEKTQPIALRAEVCRALSTLLPLISDLYGEHWGEILNALADDWSATSELQETETGMDSPIPFVHASLKLYGQLRTLTEAEDANDDLVDVWKETEQTIANGLVNLLKHSQHFPDEFHQPLKMVNDVLARQIAKVHLKLLESSEDLFPLMYVESQPVQQTAFNILHQQISAAQEQISIDSALDKTTARLPEELLSLVIEAPTVTALADASFERTMPLPLRGYLLSWLLVFSHLTHASWKVKMDYIEHIKTGDYLPGLLDFTFTFLGHAHSKPVDVSKLDVTTYTPDIEPPLRDTHWLLTHLYYLCLLHLPSLSKSWFVNTKSRPIAVTLEPWTEKHISPSVIHTAITAVSTWATTLPADSPFTVKPLPRAHEITALYALDDTSLSIRLALPPAYPLAPATIDSLHRVAVSDQKWQSWLRTSLGALSIWNGSLIDALTTFRRNVEAAMKGQTECAICYSVVGSDRRLPDKRCGTCRNAFHGGCLFKWFRSSGGSSCPLCRNAFNYG